LAKKTGPTHVSIIPMLVRVADHRSLYHCRVCDRCFSRISRSHSPHQYNAVA